MSNPGREPQAGEVDSMSETEPAAMAHALSLVAQGVLVVAPDGAIWRVAERRKTRNVPVPPRRAESPSGRGYLRVVVGLGGRTVSVMAHRLVWTVLRGPIPPGLQINHIDLQKQNNDPSNLEVVTGAENIRHSYANGRPAPWHKATIWRGRRRANTAENIAMAKSMRASGATMASLAATLCISVSHARRMISVK